MQMLIFPILTDYDVIAPQTIFSHEILNVCLCVPASAHLFSLTTIYGSHLSTQTKLVPWKLTQLALRLLVMVTIYKKCTITQGRESYGLLHLASIGDFHDKHN